MSADSKISIQKTTHSRLAEVDINNLPFGKYFTDHQFVAHYKDGKWDEGKIIPFGNISLHPGAPVLHYGESIFEGLKAIRNEKNDVLVFRPQANAKRLNHSAERMCLAQVPESLFMNGLKTLLDIDRSWVPTAQGSALYIRPFLFSTDPFIGLKMPTEFCFMIILSPVGKYYSEAVKVKIETHYSRVPQGGTGHAKAGGNYGGSLYPAKLVQEKGFHQLLWTDATTHEYIEESGTMNVMFVINGTLTTPPLGDSILAGITRDSILKLAKHLQIPVAERPIKATEVVDGIKNKTLTEAFGVGTAATIAPIGSVGHGDVVYDLPNPTTWKVATLLAQELDAIKYGNKPDVFGWIEKV